MPAVEVHQFAQCITCHAWSPDRTMVALCPNNTEVHIYKFTMDKWERVHVLYKHDQIISGIDWSLISNKIVTASHDRNSYVWNQEGSEWVPTLVILRLNRAALCVQWSPKENKFAVGSGAKTVCICYYEPENNWWVSKLIRKRHDSSVTSVAWHPDNIFLATTSTDGKCRVFSTFIKGVDTKDSGTSSSRDLKFGEQIVQLDLSSSWSFGVKWSPSGNTLAYAGHNSTVYFVDDVCNSPSAQNVAYRNLPLRDVGQHSFFAPLDPNVHLFLYNLEALISISMFALSSFYFSQILFVSERMVIGVGFDCNPMVFTKDDTGLWSFAKFLEERKTAQSNSKYGSQFSEAFGKLYGQSRHGVNDGVDSLRPRGIAHENTITCIVPLRKEGEKIVRRFSSSGLDGKVVIWELDDKTDIPQ